MENVAQTDPVTEEQWVRQIGGACDWQGSIQRLPMDRLPENPPSPLPPPIDYSSEELAMETDS